jgi:mannose-6-phosphate isomerase-like protein (cupin superfamily)
MKKPCACLLVMVFASSASAQVTPRTAIDITAEQIQATVKATEDRTVSDQSIRMVDLGKYNVGVGVVHRSPGTQGAIEHSRITEVYHMIEGAAVLVTGGTIPDAKPSAPESQVVTVLNGPSNAGSRIDGGTSRRIKAGDVVIIPPNTPHWWSSLEGRIVYLVVRVDPDKVVNLK